MNFSFIIKALFLSFFCFLLLFAVSIISSQKLLTESNNYAIKDSLKESIDIAAYRINGDIVIDQETLIKSTIENYVKNNNLKADEIEFEIAIDEENNIVTVTIYTLKNVLENDSESSYTFSYQVTER